MKCKDEFMNPVYKLWSFILLALVLLPLQGCARDYSAKSIEAWVVDAETGKPVEGANVVAHWELSYGLEGGGAYQLQIMEAVTDQNGRFFFPAWGPQAIPQHLPREARLKDRDPAIMIFKNSYEAKGIENDRPISSMGGHGASVRSSDWDGKKIPLRKFEGDLKKLSLNVFNAQSGLSFVSRGENCDWKLIPKMVLTLTKEVKLLKEQNVATQIFYIRAIDELPNQSWCGSAREFFKAYEK
jgi:hypothetical protein